MPVIKRWGDRTLEVSNTLDKDGEAEIAMVEESEGVEVTVWLNNKELKMLRDHLNKLITD